MSSFCKHLNHSLFAIFHAIFLFLQKTFDDMLYVLLSIRNFVGCAWDFVPWITGRSFERRVTTEELFLFYSLSKALNGIQLLQYTTTVRLPYTLASPLEEVLKNIPPYPNHYRQTLWNVKNHFICNRLLLTRGKINTEEFSSAILREQVFYAHQCMVKDFN